MNVCIDVQSHLEITRKTLLLNKITTSLFPDYLLISVHLECREILSVLRDGDPPNGKFARKPTFAEKSTASTIMRCHRTPGDRIPATRRVEFDRKVKLLGNSGQPEAESQFRRKVGEKPEPKEIW